MIDWSEFEQFDNVTDRYLPNTGEGTTMAEQIVTAVTKIVYKWYNDGDVYDNTNGMLTGWGNDLSSYANWLYKNTPWVKEILERVWDACSDSEYEEILWDLACNLLNTEDLESYEIPAQGTIYKCDGPFKFEEDDEEEEW
jgi:hypothetical protein